MTTRQIVQAAVTAGSVFAAATLYAVYQGGNLAWQLWGTVLAVLGLVGIGFFSPMRRIHVTRQVSPGPYHVGDRIRVTLEVTLPGGWFWPWLVVEDASGHAAAPIPRHALLAVWRRKYHLSYELPLTQRGELTLTAIGLETGDVFGLVRRQRVVAQRDSLMVWPRTISLAKWRLMTAAAGGVRQARHHRSPDEPTFYGVREYVSGDPLNHIHWKLSAHTGELKVREFQARGRAPLLIVLDDPAYFLPEDWELAVSVAASLVELSVTQRHPVGLSLFPNGSTAIAAGTGRQHEHRCLDWLATVGQAGHRARPPGPVRVRPGWVFIAAGSGPWPGDEAAFIIPVGRSTAIESVQSLEQLPAFVLAPQPRQNSRHRHG
ncbi:MAG: DUF58 domain-containing protein [Thermaerobacter sp.]|nr:DUF58 domain-containing protein [Thermaerobacter sp.]